MVPTAGFPTSCFSTDAGGVALTQIAISLHLSPVLPAVCSVHTYVPMFPSPLHTSWNPAFMELFVLLSGTVCVNEEIKPLQVCEISD